MDLWMYPAAISAGSALWLTALRTRRWWRARRQRVDNQVVLLEECRDAILGLGVSAQGHAATQRETVKAVRELASALPGDPVTKLAHDAGMIDYRVQPLYDILRIERYANGSHRAFQNSCGKSDREWCYFIVGGGALSCPNCFIATGLVCRLTPIQPAIFGKGEVSPLMVEQDRAALEAALLVWFRLGVRDYFAAPMTLLKNGEQRWDARPILIPPQQCFFVEANIAGCSQLNYVWELTIGLDGFIGEQDDRLMREREDERRKRDDRPMPGSSYWPLY